MNSSVLKNIFKIAVVTIIVTTVVSCGTKKTGVGSAGTLEKKDRTELISDILTGELKYSTISGKMNIELLPINSKKGVKTGSYVKLIRDSVIQISLRPILGAEVMRLTITPNLVSVVDRYNKKYAEEDISQLQKTTGAYFNYYNLQALLTNSLFLPGERSVLEENYKLYDVGVASDMYLAKTKDKSGMLYNFAVDASDRINSTLIFSPNNNYTLQWSYKDFVKDGGYVYPTRMEANVGVDKVRVDVNITYSKLDIDKSFDVDNSIPSRYTKSSVKDIIKAYMK